MLKKKVCERETSLYVCAEFNAAIVNRSVIEWRYEPVKYCTLRLCSKISSLMALFPRCVGQSTARIQFLYPELQ